MRQRWPPSPVRVRRRSKVAAAGLALALVAGCTNQGDSPSPAPTPDTPDRVAAELANGIARMDVSSVSFTGAAADAQAQLKAVAGGMDGKPAVTVGAVDRRGDRATAVLRYAWSFPGVAQKWTYDAGAALVEEGGSWKANWAPGVVAPGLDGANRLSERRVPAARGEILGADGDAIVTLRPVVRIGIDKTQVPAARAPASAAKLAKLVDINAKTYVAQVKAAGAKDFVEAIVLRTNAKERPSTKSVYAIEGAVPVPGDAMLAPSRTFARAVIGTVGAASKEIVDESAGRVTAGDQVGRSGLQRRYDEQLRGTPGVTVRLLPVTPSAAGPSAGTSAGPSPSPGASPSSAVARTVFEFKPVPGRDLTLTLSIPLQQLAERVLASTKPASALVALRPSTGEVLAAANGPGSDQPVATVGRFAPGSTFKVASALALLRSGLKPNSPVTCPARVTVNGKRFTNYSDYPAGALGKIPLRTALAQSCNTAFIGQRGELSGDDLAQAAASLGMGADYDVGFPAYFGSVPPDDTATGRAAALIGQGKVLASPLAMASVAASVSAGRTVVPQLVTGARAASAKAKPLTRAEAADLRAMMAAVVSEGSGRLLRGVDGQAVLAKTGTAEYGPKPPFPTHAWMIAAQGDLAVAVFVRTGASGSRTAGPLLRRFLSDAQ